MPNGVPTPPCERNANPGAAREVGRRALSSAVARSVRSGVVPCLALAAGIALRGAGGAPGPFAARLLLAWGLCVPLAYRLGFVLEGGLTWAWIGGAIYGAALAATGMLHFQSGGWRKISI